MYLLSILPKHRPGVCGLSRNARNTREPCKVRCIMDNRGDPEECMWEWITHEGSLVAVDEEHAGKYHLASRGIEQLLGIQLSLQPGKTHPMTGHRHG